MATHNDDGTVTLNPREAYFFELLKQAWYNEGISPRYHRQIKKLFNKKWQVLYLAVKGLVDDRSA